MKAREIRDRYIKFMQARGYVAAEPASLVLTDDPTTLFTGSGMQPMIPYLLGQEHPDGKLLTNSQPCIRTQDMTEVGDNRHTTFFEMLGDWSLNGFSKRQQIEWLFEFLTSELKLDPEKLFVTCFIGDEKNGIPRDDETASIWQEIFENHGIVAKFAEIGSAENGDKRGIKKGERIFFYDDKENWWSRNGGIATTPLGDPCGPDNEVFYDFGDAEHDSSFGEAHPASDSGRFMEICNKVWMQYQRQEDGSFKLFENGKVDFGAGLSRLTAATVGTPDIFKTDLYQPIIQIVEELSNVKYEENKVAMRVISDHITGAVFLAAGGLTPSNKEQGYVMRRLLRRAILKARSLGIDKNFLSDLASVVFDIYKDILNQKTVSLKLVTEVLAKEEKAFLQTLGRGLREIDKLQGEVSGRDLFKLQDTYGFPKELSVEEIIERNMKLSQQWEAEFETALAEQRTRSQTASKGVFKGGLEGSAEMHKKYHTTSHLLGVAIDEVVGKHCPQRGSNINDERLRLDFAHDKKLTDEQISKIEDIVNNAIQADYKVSFGEYDTDFALDELHATGEFREKYGDKVTVYLIGSPEKPFAVDVCGGPHVERTGTLGRFKITKEQSSSAGVRRIKAVLEQ